MPMDEGSSVVVIFSLLLVHLQISLFLKSLVKTCCVDTVRLDFLKGAGCSLGSVCRMVDLGVYLISYLMAFGSSILYSWLSTKVLEHKYIVILLI